MEAACLLIPGAVFPPSPGGTPFVTASRVPLAPREAKGGFFDPSAPRRSSMISLPGTAIPFAGPRAFLSGPPHPPESKIRRTHHRRQTRAIEHMGIDHGGGDIRVTQ